MMPRLVVAMSLAGCAADGGEWTGATTDSAGITIVQNPVRGLWTEGSGWSVEEELRIGTAGDDPEYQFGQISGLAVDEDGRIYVLDQQAGQVRAFSPDGVLERTIGRPGGGPGELGRGAAPLVLVGGDTLLVPDLQNQRVTRFLTDGTHVGSFRIAVEAGIPLRWDVMAGAPVAQLRPLAIGSDAASDTLDTIVSLSSDGTVADTLLVIPSGRTFAFTGGAPEFNLFEPEPVWAVADDSRILFGINSEYRILVYAVDRDAADRAADGESPISGADGAVERILTMPVERRRVDESDQAIIVSSLERLWQEAGLPPPVIQQLRTRVNFAEHYPAYLQFLAGPDGTIWVQRVQRASALTTEEREAYNPMLDLGAPEWDVFDADGRYLGMVRMPPRFQPLRFVEDRIYGIWRDELDVQYVKRLRIRRDAA